MDRMEEFQIIFGQELKRLRLKNKLTQSELAEKLDLSVTHISSMERGVDKPSFKTMIDLVDLLGISLEDVVKKQKEHEIVDPKLIELEAMVSKIEPQYYDILKGILLSFINNQE